MEILCEILSFLWEINKAVKLYTYSPKGYFVDSVVGTRFDRPQYATFSEFSHGGIFKIISSAQIALKLI